MSRSVFKYLKYVLISGLIALIFLLVLAYTFNHSIKYGFDKSIAHQLDQEGPFISFENDSIAKIQYIFGDKTSGFNTDISKTKIDTSVTLSVGYKPDRLRFEIPVSFQIEKQKTEYPPVEKWFAVSDQEGNFRVLKDLLLANEIIDESLSWSFGDGHLILLGDFVDKGFYVTQTLWLIYKLEQEAKKSGGHVHYILGNHEINNLQGYFRSTAQKYWYAVNILGIKRHELYGENSFLGRWLASKNVVEKIGSTIFVHGGLHPDFANSNLSLDQINTQIKTNYRKPFYQKKDADENYELLFSNKKSPAWYRGYFNDDLDQKQIDALLEKYEANEIVVGHTTISKVSKHHQGKVIGIDVKSALDHLNYFPPRRTEGLLFENGSWYRVNDNGLKKHIKK